MTLDSWRHRNLRRWRPLAILDEVERMMEQPSAWLARETTWTPAIDLYEKDDAFVVRAEIPGVKAEDMDVSVSGDNLTIKGERKAKTDVKKEDYQYSEVFYGSFARTIPLPQPVASDKIEATYDDGILEVRLPKAEKAKVAKIEIKPAKSKK